MKLVKIFLVCLFIGVTICDDIKVGFYMANIEGFNYTADETNKILKVLAKSSNENTTNDNSILNSSFIDNIEGVLVPDHDILLFSFQETNSDFAFSLKTQLTTKEWSDWTCHNAIIKKGFTHFSKKLTYTYICYKKERFTVTFEKNAGLIDWALDLKEAIGICLKDKKSAKSINYCFIGSHLDTNLLVGGNIVKGLFSSLNKKFNKKDYVFYIIGDLNLRTWFDINEENIKDIEKSNVDKGLPIRKDVIKGDSEAMNGFKSILTTLKSSIKFEFCGVDNIYKLPYTYNYLNPTDGDLNEIKNGQIDLAHVLKQKSATKEKKVNNLGWLDRLACGYASNIDSCFIKGGNGNVQYFAVPFLRKADHMPVVGHFRISDGNRKLK